MTAIALTESLRWVPDVKAADFIAIALQKYEEIALEGLPGITHITYEMSDPFIVELASLRDTGDSLEYSSHIFSMNDSEGDAFVNNVVDENFNDVFADVWNVLERLNMSFCFNNETDIAHWPKQYFKYPAIEVW